MRAVRLSFGLLLLAASAQVARAQTVIDFEEYASTSLTFRAGPLLSKGFQFDVFLPASPFNVHTPCLFVGCWGTTGSNDLFAFAGFAGSTGLFSGTASWTKKMSKVGGGSFSISRMDVARRTSGGSGPDLSFQVFGDLIGGGTISQTFFYTNPMGNNVYTSEFFDSRWTGLADIYWSTGCGTFGCGGEVQVDNIDLDGAGLTTTAPEPASILLVGSGLLGVCTAARRRRR